MPIRGTRRLAVAGAAGALLLAAAAALVLAPRWINADRARAAAAAYLSGALGGTVDFRSVELRLFPGPRAVFHEVRVVVPGRWSGTARSLAVHPRVAPLLRGRLVPARIRAEGADVAAEISWLTGTGPEKPFDMEEFRKTASGLLAAASRAAPGLRVEAARGRLAVAREGRTIVTLRDIEGRATMPPGRLRAELRCDSGSWGRISLEGAIDPRTLDGSAEVAGARIDAAALGKALLPAAPISFSGDALGLSASVETLGLRSVRAAVKGAAQSIELRGRDRALGARTVRFAGSIAADGRETAVTVTELSAGSPDFRAAGTFVARGAARRIRLGLRARDTRVETVRDALVLLSGDAAPVREAFSRVESGALPELAVDVDGTSPPASGAAAIGALSLSARLRGGTVRVREAGLLFTDVAAAVTVRRGLLSADNVAARLGSSRVLSGTLSMGLSGGRSPFRAALSVDADLADVRPILLRATEGGALERRIREVDAVQGRAAGRLYLGDRLDAIRATADVSDMRFSARPRTLAGPVAVASGRLRIDPETLSWSGVRARVLDASLELSGTLAGYSADARSFDAAFSGTLGPDAVRLAFERLRVPRGLFPRAPLSVSRARLAWGADNGLSAAAAFAAAGGPAVSLDVSRKGGDLEVRDLSIRDGDARAAASFSLTAREIRFSFAGRLSAQTLNRLLADADFPRGRVEGDFSAHVPRDRPGRSTARGRLEAEGIRVPEIPGPLTIETVVLSASGSRVDVKPSALSLGRSRFTLAGSAEASERGLRVDMDVGADSADWAALRGILPARAAGPGAGRLPQVTGVVRVAADAFDFGGRTWKPLRAEVTLAPDATRVAVREAGLCGVHARGEAVIAASETAVDFQGSSAGPDAGPVLSCLRDEQVKMTGRYELAVRVAGRGNDNTLPRAITGGLAFRASDGRIFKATLLSKLLAILNVTQVVFGKLPDLAHDGFAYNSLWIRGDMTQGKLVIREAKLDAASMNLSGEGEFDYLADRLDVVVLASPLKTVDAIVRRIPVLGYILGGSVLSVPFQVTGNLDDPAISVLPPAAVGKGLLGVVERTLKAPVKLFEPILPKSLRDR